MRCEAVCPTERKNMKRLCMTNAVLNMKLSRETSTATRKQGPDTAPRPADAPKEATTSKARQGKGEREEKERNRTEPETRRRAKGGDYLKSEARKGESQAGAKGVEDRERASEPVDANLWERKRESKPANKLMAT